MKRNFAEQPRTLRESLEIIEKEARNGRLICHQFVQSNGKGKPLSYDAIGSLMTARQRRDIYKKDQKYDCNSSQDLYKFFGKQNIDAMTGMSDRQISSIITEADSIVERDNIKFADKIKAILASGKGKIGSSNFVL